MVMDWGALMESMISGIGDMITAFITALSDNAEQIADLLIFGVITGAVIKFGSNIFKGLSSALNGMF